MGKVTKTDGIEKKGPTLASNAKRRNLPGSIPFPPRRNPTAANRNSAVIRNSIGN